MIYNRIVSAEELGRFSHLEEISADTLNSEDNIHPKYNFLKGDYSALEVNKFCSHSNIDLISQVFTPGICLPFKILSDESLQIDYDVVSTGASLQGLFHIVQLVCKGIIKYELITQAISGTNSFTHNISIVGTLQDGYLFIGAKHQYPVTVNGSIIINNLIIS